MSTIRTFRRAVEISESLDVKGAVEYRSAFYVIVADEGRGVCNGVWGARYWI